MTQPRLAQRQNGRPTDQFGAAISARAGSAGTLLTRRTEDDAGRSVEYARDVYRADRAAFEVSEVLTVDRTPV